MGEKKLGEGSYGAVYEYNKNAVKVFSSLKDLIIEYCALIYLRDIDNVVKCLDLDLVNKNITMQLYKSDFSSKKKHMDENEFLKYFSQVLIGLIYIHDLNLVHADIKPSNILISGDKCVLADCGFLNKEPNRKCNLTSARYRDPFPRFKKSHDIYSCGIMLLDFFGINERDSDYFILSNNFLPIKAENEKLYKNLLESIEKAKDNKNNCYKLIKKEMNDIIEKSKIKNDVQYFKSFIEKCMEKSKLEEAHINIKLCDSIKNDKIRKITINLLSVDERERMSCRDLYYELYNKTLPQLECKKLKIEYLYLKDNINKIYNYFNKLNSEINTKTENERFVLTEESLYAMSINLTKFLIKDNKIDYNISFIENIKINELYFKACFYIYLCMICNSTSIYNFNKKILQTKKSKLDENLLEKIEILLNDYEFVDNLYLRVDLNDINKQIKNLEFKKIRKTTNPLFTLDELKILHKKIYKNYDKNNLLQIEYSKKNNYSNKIINIVQEFVEIAKINIKITEIIVFSSLMVKYFKLIGYKKIQYLTLPAFYIYLNLFKSENNCLNIYEHLTEIQKQNIKYVYYDNYFNNLFNEKFAVIKNPFLD